MLETRRTGDVGVVGGGSWWRRFEEGIVWREIEGWVEGLWRGWVSMG